MESHANPLLPTLTLISRVRVERERGHRNSMKDLESEIENIASIYFSSYSIVPE
jgi:hypothetical protein